MKQPANSRKNRGFTLVESLGAVALSGIVLGAGVPGMNHLVANQRIAGETASILTHLHTARSEAVKRGIRTVLCPTNDKLNCLGHAHWGQGYMIFVDSDGNGKRATDEPLLRYHKTNSQVRGNSYWKKKVAYDPNGWALNSNLTIAVCDVNQYATPKAIVVSFTGRPRVDDKHPSGKALTCPAS